MPKLIRKTKRKAKKSKKMMAGWFGGKRKQYLLALLIALLFGIAMFFGSSIFGDYDWGNGGSDGDGDNTSTDTTTTTTQPPEPARGNFYLKMTVNWVPHNFTGTDLPFTITDDSDGSTLFSGTWFLVEDGDSYTFAFVLEPGDAVNVIFDTVDFGLIGLYAQWNGVDVASIGESLYAPVGFVSLNTHMVWSTWGPTYENAVNIGIEFIPV